MRGTASAPDAMADSHSGQPDGPLEAEPKVDQHTEFRQPLPGDDKTWKECCLGPVNEWSESLQTLTQTLSCLSHPAVILWGDDYILLHNEAWSEVGGQGGQGRRQRESYSAPVLEALQAALRGGRPRRINGRDLMRNTGSGAVDKYTTLLSPLFDREDEKACGLLVQLLPGHSQLPDTKQNGDSKNTETSPGSDHMDAHLKDQSVDISQLGQSVDNTPLDEHPFFHRFAEMLPSGLAILDSKAQAVFVNQHFYELTTHHGDDKAFSGWPQSIHPDDYERVMHAYDEAFKSQQQLRTEFRAQGMKDAWRLLLLTPLGDENLQHVSLREHGGFICSVVDISSEKSAELTERKAANDARERKEQQERFIDMVSHEIRNPLSAVLHCNEDIAESVRDRNNIDIDTILSCVETIDICITHQKNIVNDVLSYSKLDASMLSLSPRPSQPRQQLAASLRMFQPEFKKQHIEFAYQIDSSYVDSKIDWVMADLARIGQVLINLVSNAIKFTARKEGEKRITITVAGSIDRPDSYPPNVVFFGPDDGSSMPPLLRDMLADFWNKSEVNRLDATQRPEWGEGKIKYVMVAVKDTGIGITDDGQKRLFERFRQATPKTEEVYGGSGLGLNISRKLCHLHGGEVGVSSKEGDGSTFGFFFKVRQAEQPQDWDGRPEQDEVDLRKLREEVEAHGIAADQGDLPISDIPQTLREPPITDDEATRPSMPSKNDQRYQRTNEIVSSMQEERDSDSAADGPVSSAEHKKHIYAQKFTDVPDRGKATGTSGGGSETEATADSKMSVLLVEDNVINQRIVYRKLQSKGFNVTTANNGQEAVDTLVKRSGRFDVVLMDQEMPIMDGNSAARKIRELERIQEIQHIPILGLTAHVRDEHKEEMKQAGMDDFIIKPYKIEELVQKMEYVVDEARAHRRRISLG